MSVGLLLVATVPRTVCTRNSWIHSQINKAVLRFLGSFRITRSSANLRVVSGEDFGILHVSTKGSKSSAIYPQSAKIQLLVRVGE